LIRIPDPVVELPPEVVGVRSAHPRPGSFPASSEEADAVLLLSVQGNKARWFNSLGVPVGQVIEHSAPIKLAVLRHHLLLAGEDGVCRAYGPYDGKPRSLPIRPEGGVVNIVASGLFAGTQFLILGGRQVFTVDFQGEFHRLANGDKPLRNFDKPLRGVTERREANDLLLQFEKEARLLALGTGKNPEQMTGQLTPALVHEEPITRAWLTGGTNHGFGGSPPALVVTLSGNRLRCWAEHGKLIGPPIPVEEPPLLVRWPVKSGTSSASLLWVLTASGHQLWNCLEGKPAGPLLRHPSRVAFRALLARKTPGENDPLTLVDSDGQPWRWTNASPVPVFRDVYRDLFVPADGNRLVTVSTHGELRSWELAGAALRPAKLHIQGVRVSAFFWKLLLQKGRHVILVRAGVLERWDTATGQRLWRGDTNLRGAPDLFFLEASDRLLAQAGRTFQLWNAVTGAALTPPTTCPWPPRITPDGRFLIAATGGVDKRVVRAWRLDTGAETPAPDLPGDPWRTEGALSLDWRRYLAPVVERRVNVGFGGNVQSITLGYRVHDGKTGKPITPLLPASEPSPYPKAFSQDGNYVQVGNRIYEAESGNPVTPVGAKLAEWTVDVPLPQGSRPLADLLGIAPSWTWRPGLLTATDVALASATRLAVGRRVDEGGEIVALQAAEYPPLREQLARAPLPIDRQARRIDDLRRLLFVRDQPEVDLLLLDRLSQLQPDAADLKTYRESAVLMLADRKARAGDFVTAARIFREQFQRPLSPFLTTMRYRAAGCAARAGTWERGQFHYGPEKEFTALRNQARDWLRAELDSRRAAFEREPSPAPAAELMQWLNDPDFRAVRDDDLQRLPAAEVEAWKKLWADVADLCRRAEAAPMSRWRVEKGELVQGLKYNGPGWLLFGKDDWTDFTLELEARREAGGVDGFGIGFRATGPGDTLMFNFGGWGNQRHGIERVEKGVYSPYPQSQPGTIESGRWYKVCVVARGNEFTGYLDGVEVLRFTEARNPRGKLGLRSWGTVNRFRSIRVTDPSGKLLFEGLPEVPAGK
jgi:hypothetical protein